MLNIIEPSSGGKRFALCDSLVEFCETLPKCNYVGKIGMRMMGRPNNMFVSFIAPNGELITKLNVTFADTGGKSPQGKTNAFMNFSAYLK